MNKLALITGANAGIGLATAQGLAAQGYDLILWCRNEAKAKEAQQLIQQKYPTINIELSIADLGNLAATRQAAQQLAHRFPKLDVLVNNAGFVPETVEFTDSGIEKTLYASHLGHFVLTLELLKNLEQAEDPRIINVSSEGHRFGNFNDFFVRHHKGAFATYGDAKLANVLFTLGLRTHLAQTRIQSYALHPGMIDTKIAHNTKGIFKFFVWLAKPFLATPEKGAATSVYLATTPTSKIPNDLYFEKCKPRKTANKAITPENAEKLWQKSLELIQQEII